MKPLLKTTKFNLILATCIAIGYACSILAELFADRVGDSGALNILHDLGIIFGLALILLLSAPFSIVLYDRFKKLALALFGIGTLLFAGILFLFGFLNPVCFLPATVFGMYAFFVLTGFNDFRTSVFVVNNINLVLLLVFLSLNYLY